MQYFAHDCEGLRSLPIGLLSELPASCTLIVDTRHSAFCDGSNPDRATYWTTSKAKYAELCDQRKAALSPLEYEVLAREALQTWTDAVDLELLANAKRRDPRHRLAPKYVHLPPLGRATIGQVLDALGCTLVAAEVHTSRSIGASPTTSPLALSPPGARATAMELPL